MLSRADAIAVGFVTVTVETQEVDRPADEVVVALVAGEREVVEIGLAPDAGGIPVVIAEDGEEAVGL